MKAVAIVLLLYIAVFAGAIVSPVIAFFIPLPLLYYYSSLGRLQGFAIFIISCLSVACAAAIIDVPIHIAHFFLFAALGPILSEVIRKNYSIERTLLYSIGLFLSLGLLILLYFSLVRQISPWLLIQGYIADLVNDTIKAYSETGISSPQIELVKENAEQITRALYKLFPAFLVIGSSLYILFNILAGRMMFRRNAMWYPDFGDFSCWKLPDKAIWFAIISGGAVLLPYAFIRIAAFNILILTLFVYLLQGLSIVSFFFKRKNVPLVLRALGYFLIFTQRFFLLFIVLLGLIDVWADFRKLSRIGDESSP